MEETIDYRQLRTIMEMRTAAGQPIPFSLVVVTANRDHATGGEIKEYTHAVKYSLLNRKTKSATVSHNPETASAAPGPRDPQHYKHQTTNLAILAKDTQTNKLKIASVTKIHYKLILYINGKRIFH